MLGFAGRDQRAELIAELRAVFSSPEAAAALGRRYLASQLNVDREALWRDLGVVDAQRGGRLPLAVVVDRRRDRDFRDGNLVGVGGWMLARCEAAACALLALA